MQPITLLRRLAEQQDYPALRDACLGSASADPGVRVLRALAEVHLGDACAARRIVESLDPDALPFDARIDLAAVQMTLGEIDRAVALLEAARPEAAASDKAAHALLLTRLGWCRERQERLDEAVDLYRESISLQPSIGTYQNLLRLYRERGRLDEMARCLEAAWSFWSEEQAGWPDDRRRMHGQLLRARQLELLLAREPLEAADAWIDGQRDTLDEHDWCALLCALAIRLAAGDRHAEAEDRLRGGLSRFPEHLPLLDQLADLALVQGRTYQALALLRRAIRIADARGEPSAALWIRFSSAALQSDPRLARRAAERAAEQLPRLAETRPADEIAALERQVELSLAAVEAAEQDHEAAERRYRRLLERRQDLGPALLGLGQLALNRGRIDEAVALFERAKAVDPSRGYGALISARRFPTDDATLERLERLARTPTLEGSVRTGLLFQLASAWEHREDYERAFALADEANAACRRLLRYDPRAHRQHCARIRHAFPASLYEHRPDCGHPSELPVFVVGMPRSGTTLVEQILAGHSRIHGAGELGTIPRVIAGLERWERHTGSGRGYPDCVDDLDPAVVRGIAEGILQELREYSQDVDRVVDKLPHNFENLGLIRLLFPRAKVISVRRDPRDIAISNYFTNYARRHAGMAFAYDLEWIGEQLADHNLLMHHWQRVWPEGILEIRYEDLIDDPETSARRMLDHVGLDWEPQVLDFTRVDRPVNTASAWQVRQPLYAESKGRWRRYRRHLKPLIAAINRRISWEPIEMVTLPEPGWLNSGVDRYREGDLDGAEYRFKQLLRHLPTHAAARFMLGLVYVQKGHRRDGIALMEQALERCPWNANWRRDLAQAYRLDGRADEADKLADTHRAAHAPGTHHTEEPVTALDYLFLSGESTCSSFASAPAGANC